jgi:catechol 2,3-dioxygenase-like lactoylglutathione lyase family enzyme
VVERLTGIGAVHLTLFSTDPEATRTFFSDVLELDSVDAGGGWPIFALPPAELGIHPTEGEPLHELYLMCDDIDATVARLEQKGVPLATPVSDEGWGLVAYLPVPGLARLGLYEPRHPSPPRA